MRQHVLGVRRKLADVDDEIRAAGTQRERHHGDVGLAMVQRAEGGDFLGAEEVAEGLGVGGGHQLNGSSALIQDIAAGAAFKCGSTPCRQSASEKNSGNLDEPLSDSQKLLFLPC